MKFFDCRRFAGVFLLFALTCAGCTGNSEKTQKKPIMSISQLNDPAYTVAVSESGAYLDAVNRDLPKAKRIYLGGQPAYDAVRLGKADAYAFDRVQMEIAIAEGMKGVRVFPGSIGEKAEIAVGISRASKFPGITDKINTFIAELKADGTLQDMYQRWTTGSRKMPDIPVPEKADTKIVVGTTGLIMPFSYYEENILTGFDVELSRRFAKWLGAELEFKVYNFEGVIAAAEAGAVDCVMSDLNITPERAEKIDFSDVLYTEEVALMVKDDAPVSVSEASAEKGYYSVSELDGKRIGVFTGAVHDQMVKKALPKAECVYFDSLANALSAVTSGKIDALACDGQIIKAVEQENSSVRHIDEYLEPFNNAFIVSKTPEGGKIRTQLNEFIRSLKSDGTLQQILDIWEGTDESRKTLPDYENYPDTNGSIRIAADNTTPPFTYVKNGRLVGYEIDIIARFCRAYGYRPDIDSVSFPAILPAVKSGKCLIGISSFTITEERKESVNFTEPTYTGGAMLLVKKTPKDLKADTSSGGYTKIADLNGKRIGVLTGSIGGEILKGTLPAAKVFYLDNYADMSNSLSTGKIDAILEDDFVVFGLEHDNPDFRHIDGYLRTFDKAFIFTKSPEGDKIRTQFNEFIRTLKADGTLKKISDVWLGFDENAKTLPDYESYPDTNGTIKFAVDNTTPTFSYVKDGRIVGYDADILTRFCKAYGYRPEPSAMNFSGELPAVNSGKCLVGISAIAITPERAETVNFSEPVYTGGAMLLVKKSPEELRASQSNTPSDIPAPAKYTRLADLRGKKIGIQTGVDAWAALAKKLIPDAEVLFFNDITSLAAALESRKIDAFLENSIAMAMLMSVNKNITVLNENVSGGYDGAAAFRKDEKGEKLKAQWDEYITALKKDGKINALMDKWTGPDESAKTIPDYESFPAPNGVLVLATDGNYPPLSYYSGNTLTGFEIDLAARFCEAYGYGLKIQLMAYSGILPSLAVGKCDFSVGAASVSEEHKETLTLSEPYYTYATKIAVLASQEDTQASAENTHPANTPAGKYTGLEALNGKRIGVITGVDTWADIVHKLLPDSEVAYYNGYADMALAVTSGKIAAFVCDVPVLDMLMLENKNIASLGTFINESIDIAVGFPNSSQKSIKLKSQWDEFITALKNTGELESVINRWTRSEHPEKNMPDYASLPSPNGVLVMAADGENPPFSYYSGNRLAGFEIELAAKFCEAYGYGLRIKVMTYDAVIAAVQSGKCDFALADIPPSQEHAENILFSIPYYAYSTTLAVPADSSLTAEAPAPKTAARTPVPAVNAPAAKTSAGKYTSLADLNGKRIGVATGVDEWADIVHELLPDSEVAYYDEFTDMILAMTGRKIDAFVCDVPVLDMIMQENKNVASLGVFIGGSFDIAAAFPKSDQSQTLKAQFDEFITALKNTGELDSIINKWTSAENTDKAIPEYKALPAPNGVLEMAADGTNPPFSYYIGQNLGGFEIELAVKFCEAYGYGLKIDAMSYEAVLAAVRSGKCDFSLAGLVPSEEHAENVLFSVPYYVSSTAVAIPADKAPSPSGKTPPSPRTGVNIMNDLAGKTIGVMTGTTHPQIALKYVPTAKLVYFDTFTDTMTALKTRKVDAVCTAVPFLRDMMTADASIVPFGEQLTFMDCAPVFPKTEKGRKLCEQFSEFAKACWDNGTIKELESIWFDTEDSRRVMKDYSVLPSPNGTLRMAVDASMPPCVYMKDNRIAGYDVDFAVRFCEAYGYGLEIMPMSFAGIIPALSAGRCDFGIGTITITDERKESVLFAYPNLKTGNIFAVRKEDTQSLNSLSGKKIGIILGANHDTFAAEKIPDAKIEYFSDLSTITLALRNGKISAFANTLPTAIYMTNAQKDLAYISEPLESTYTYSSFTNSDRGRKICREYEEFLRTLWADGTIDTLADKWVYSENESARIIDDYSKLPAVNGVLKMAIDTGRMPFAYVKDNRIVGYDIELAAMFCKAKGYGLEVYPLDFAGILGSIKTGKCDLTGSITWTEERAETMLYSSVPNAQTDIVLIVMNTQPAEKKPAPESASGLYTNIKDLAGKKVAVQTGTICDQITARFLPTAELVYFDTQTDLVTALKTNKADAICTDIPIAKYMMSEYSNMAMLGEALTEDHLAPIFAKTEAGRKLCGKFTEFTKAAWENGTIQELESIWFGSDDSRRILKDYSNLPAPNGKLRMAVDPAIVPFAYMKANRIIGYDVDFAVRFCEAYGYGLEIMPMNFSGMIPAVMSGKCDLAICAIAVTPERAENVLFSEPNAKSGTGFFVRKSDSQSQPVQTSGQYNSLEEIAGRRIAVQTGTASALLVEEKLPDAKIQYFDSLADTLVALKAGKVDALAATIFSASHMVNTNDDITILDHWLRTTDISPIFTKSDRGRKICEEYSEFIKGLWEDGTIDKLNDIWLGPDESRKIIKDYSNLPAPNGVIRLAVDTSMPPLAYVRDNKVVGYDIDLAVRFCEAKGYGLQITQGTVTAALAEVMSGKSDMSMSLMYTEERAENALFPKTPSGHSGNVIVVMKAKPESSEGEYSSFEELAGKNIGAQTGTPNGDFALKAIPTANIHYFDGFADIVTALKMRRIDAAALALNVARFMLLDNEDLALMGKPLAELDAAPIFAKTDKGRELCEQFNEFIKAQWDNGTLQELDSIWFGRDDSKRTPKDYASLPAPNGVLKMAVDTSFAPFAYVKDNRIVGYEIDCAVKFCQENGYGLEVIPMNFGAIIAAVQSGKCDFASSSIAITPERAEQVLFASPNAKTGCALVVRKAKPQPVTVQPKTETPSPAPRQAAPSQPAPQIQTSPSQISAFMEDASVFFEELKASFNRTFIREERWRLFVEGIINTMIITVLSILFGTILGFVVYLLCRGGNVFANLLTRFFIWLIEGTPMVVLLMILYYIIFGKVDIPGIWVAVIAFTMTFGAGFFGMLKSGTGALDKGQTEAAYALGFSDTQTFFTVILPQAALHFMPAYKSSVVALIKATAIVGYIAVQDLTKMGDIVRSRTYEAFFPLIAVAVIYFVLAGLLNIIVGMIHNRIRPEKRTKDDILRGIDTHD